MTEIRDKETDVRLFFDAISRLMGDYPRRSMQRRHYIGGPLDGRYEMMMPSEYDEDHHASKWNAGLETTAYHIYERGELESTTIIDDDRRVEFTYQFHFVETITSDCPLADIDGVIKSSKSEL